LESNLELAYSLLKTRSTGLSLIGVIDRAQMELEAFARLQAPVAVPFTSDRMKNIFAELTIKMRTMD